MSNPTSVSYFGVPGYLVLWLFVLISFSLFSWRMLHYARILRGARPENHWDRLPERVWLFLTYALGQRRLFEEPLIGTAHLLIFWAFIFHAAGFLWNLFKGLFPFLAIPFVSEVRWMAFALEVLGVLALVSLLITAARRYVFPPPHLERAADATLVLKLISALMLLSFLSAEGLRSLTDSVISVSSPVGTFLSHSFAAFGITPAMAPSLYLWAWWIYMIAGLGLLAYMAMSDHLHVLASPLGVFFAALRRGSVPPASEGASRREEFTWRQLLNGLTCAECGRCDRACPALSSGLPLSPKLLMRHMKELLRTPTPAQNPATSMVGTEELWACMACYACMERCPILNEHVPLIVEMRRSLMGQGEVDARLQTALVNLTRYGNSFGKPERTRPTWREGLDFKIKDARNEPVEYLWFVGDYASYDPTVQAITRAVATVFHAAGVDFGVLYEGERNAGNDVRRVGEEGLFEILREKNLQALEKAKFEKIMTTDPHSYHVLKNEYSWTNGKGKVLHHTELLDSLIEAGKLPLRRSLDCTVTYHDPCYLGRCNGVYDPPRRVLRALGAKIEEMPRSFTKSYCCGAGGGRIWMEEPPSQKERPSENRVREAVALNKAQYLVVTCPKDVVMFRDAIKTTGNEERISAKEISELVAEAL